MLSAVLPVDQVTVELFETASLEWLGLVLANEGGPELWKKTKSESWECLAWAEVVCWP